MPSGEHSRIEILQHTIRDVQDSIKTMSYEKKQEIVTHTQEQRRESITNRPGNADKAATSNMFRNLKEVTCTMGEHMGISTK